MDPSHDIYRKEEPALATRRKRRRPVRKPRNLETDPGTSPPPNEPRHSSSRRRRRSSRGNKSESGGGSRLIWVVLILVFVIYALFLMVNLIRGRFASPKQEATVVEAVSEEDAAAAEVAAADASEIKALIKGWNRIPDAILEAQAFQDRGMFDKAEERLRRALESSPDAARLQIKLAQILVEKREFEEAQKTVIQVLEDNPNDNTARLLLGSVYEERTNYPAALIVAKWVLETNPNSTKAHKLAADSYLNTDSPGLAIPHLRRVMALDRHDLLAQNKLGATYALIGENVKAIQIFNDALSKDTTDQMTYFNLATCYAKQGMAEQSVEMLSRASSLFGDSFVATWLSDDDFNNIRDESIFAALAEHITETAKAKKKKN